MPDANRDRILKEAAELARKGKLDQAVRQYEAALAISPEDWATANLAGDLCLRHGDTASAARLFRQAGDLLADEGFHAKAAAIFKKILKIFPQDEHARLRAGEIAERQELFADADAHFRAVAALRRSRGDIPGAEEIEARLKRGETEEAAPAASDEPIAAANAETPVASPAPDPTTPPQAEPAGQVELVRGEEPRSIPPSRTDPAPAVVAIPKPPQARIADLRATLDDGTEFIVSRPAAPVSGEAGVPAAAGPWQSAVDGRGIDALADRAPDRASLDLAQIDDSLILEGAWRDVVRLAARPEWLRDAAERASASPSLAPALPELAPAVSMETPQEEILDEVALFEQMRTGFVAAYALRAQDWFADGQRRIAGGDLAAGIGALERASSAISVRSEAASVLGRHYLRAGDPRAALAWLERAAEAGSSDPEAGQALVYDIGCALQDLGEESRAFAVLNELRREVGGPWRDLDDRIGRLSGLP